MPRLVSLVCGVMLLLVFLFARPGRHDLACLLVKALLVAAVVSSVIGLLQYFGASPALSPWINITVPGYAFGNLRQRNQLGSLLNIGLAVLVWGVWARRFRVANAARSDLAGHGPGASRRVAKLVGLLLSLVLLVAANAATTSRTGLVQLAALLVLALVWRRQAAPGTWRILGGAVLIYGAASVLLPLWAGLDPFVSGIAARFNDGGQNCESRIFLWQNVLHLIAQKPWFGWGWGELDYAHFIAVYPGVRFCDILDNAHNLPLHLAVELGVPVALVCCALVSWWVVSARPWRELDADRQMAWSVLAMIALHSMLEYPLWYGPFQVTTLLAVWILWRTPPRMWGVAGNASRSASATATASASASASATAPRPGFGASPLVMTCAVLILAALAYAAWDYRRVSQIYLAPALRASAYREDTLRKLQDSWLFQNQVRFAALTLTTVTPDNATGVFATANALLHFSPEARVVEKLIDSALVLGRDEEAAFYMLRYRNAFPAEYARWEQRASYGPLPKIDP